MNSTLEVIFGLLGGLAVFIFGMNMMSDCLQKAAGEKMKRILALLTKNPILGVLAGALTTAVLQSSSATTVMAIGFVSAGLMNLPQAISIILGANIGTTMTAQIIAFKLSDYIYAIIFIGFIISFVVKSERAKNIGQTIFAFGLLFLGIETMGSVMKPLASSPIFTDMIEQVSHIPVLGVAVGTLMTLVVQSSSATIAVLQNFAEQPGPDGVSSILGLVGAIHDYSSACKYRTDQRCKTNRTCTLHFQHFRMFSVYLVCKTIRSPDPVHLSERSGDCSYFQTDCKCTYPV